MKSCFEAQLRRGAFKLIWGEPRKLSRPQGSSNKERKRKAKAGPALQLFKLDTDPNELQNLATDPQYRDKLEDLQTWALQLASQMVTKDNQKIHVYSSDHYLLYLHFRLLPSTLALLKQGKFII